MERRLLDEDTARAIFCLKNGYHEDGKNYYGIEAFLHFWKRENGGSNDPLDYIRDGAPQRLRWALEDLAKCSDHPDRLFRDYLDFEAEYDRFAAWGLLTEIDKLSGPRLYALAHTLRNAQIRDSSEKGELHCINGFTEESIADAIEYVGVAKDEDEE